MIKDDDICTVSYMGTVKRFESNIGNIAVVIFPDKVNVQYITNTLYTKNVQGFMIPDVEIIEKSCNIASTIKASEIEDYQKKQMENLKNLIRGMCTEAVGEDVKDVRFHRVGSYDEEWEINDVAMFIANTLLLRKL